MKNDLDIFNNLYGDDDELVFKALTAKKDWMFEKYLYAKGHINTTFDSNGRVHYPFIESMLDETLLFEDVKINDSSLLTDVLKIQVESLLNDHFQFLNLYDSIDGSAPFYVEYDFDLIDNNGFNILFPNFFRKHDFEFWNIDLERIKEKTDDVVEQLKLAFVGNEGEYVIVMDKINLINNALFAPVARKIIARSDIEEELKIELKSIAEEKEIEYEEVSYVR